MVTRTGALALPVPAPLLAFATVIALTACGSGGGGEGSNVSTFSKSYGGPLHDEARVVLNADDGGILLFGTADAQDPYNPGDFSHRPGGNFWVQKLDANGNVEHSRTIGLRAPVQPDTDWKRARLTADGGTVLVGTRALKQPVNRPDGSTVVVTTGRDIAITKLDANGNATFNVSHDSGAWQDYDYFESNGFAAAAEDWGEDVWPMADGGFLVVGFSVGNLEDRLRIGFPCDDEELNTLAGSRSNCGGRVGYSDTAQAGFRFQRAFSVVVMRLNADGSLRGPPRRLIDNPYDTENNEATLFRAVETRESALLVRATADGGAVLARPVDRTSVLVHRLRADLSSVVRTVIDQVLPFGGRGPSGFPVGLSQTDDPVDGPDGDRPDGEPDDGFVLATPQFVIKLDASGALQWRSDVPLACESTHFASRPFAVNDVTQHCDYGRPTRCDIIAVGTVWMEEEPDRLDTQTFRTGFAAFIDEGGGLREQATTIRSERDEGIGSLLRIVPTGAGRFGLIGILANPRDSLDHGDFALIDLQAASAQPGFENERDGHLEVDLGPSQVELRSDGGALLLTESGLRLMSFDAQARTSSDLNIRSEITAETLRTAVEIGPGRYVLAGTRRAPGGQSGVVALRYDLDTGGGRLVWQRQVLADELGVATVEAAAASSDGGVVLSLTGRDAQLLKLDADGGRQWRLALPGPTMELHRATDSSGFVALSSESSESSDLPTAVVTRLSAGGEVLWRKRVCLKPGSSLNCALQGPLTTMTPTADGGLMLAGAYGDRIGLLRLTSDGTTAWASEVALPAAPGQQVSAENPRIRQLADGGFVLTMTERGLLTRLSGDGATLPFGQSNVLVVALDAAGNPQWSHVYGALYDEGVRDLAVRADGTIVVAGYSDSLGERREAWLLKLSPRGLISEGGCRACLATIPSELLATRSLGASVADDRTPLRDLAELPSLALPQGSVYEQQDFVTARQCLGDAAAGAPPTSSTPPGPTYRLSVLQVGTQPGVVTSVPNGIISCHTGPDICSADIPQGNTVTLRADPGGFVAWRGDCDFGTGGTQLACAIVMTRNRTMQVEFGPPLPPPPPQRFELAFAVQGNGLVRADGGIECSEGSPASACAQTFASGTIVNASAVALSGHVFLGWSGTSADSPCSALGQQADVRITTVDRDLRCFAQFGPATERLVSVAVSGGGVVHDEPATGAFNCREGGSAADCQEIYSGNATVTLRAIADAGQRFVQWGGDCTSSGGNSLTTLLAAQSLSCTATFAPVPTAATLTVQLVNGGPNRSVTSDPAGINCSGGVDSDCSESYVSGTLVALRATPLEQLQSWQGCDEIAAPSICRVQVDRTRLVTAQFLSN